MPEYARICLNKNGSEYGRVLNIPGAVRNSDKKHPKQNKEVLQ